MDPPTVYNDERDCDRDERSIDCDGVLEEAMFEDGHLSGLAHPNVPGREFVHVPYGV